MGNKSRNLNLIELHPPDVGEFLKYKQMQEGKCDSRVPAVRLLNRCVFKAINTLLSQPLANKAVAPSPSPFVPFWLVTTTNIQNMTIFCVIRPWRDRQIPLS